MAESYTVTEALLKSDREAILPVTRQIIGKAESLTAADAFRGTYRLKELARLAEPVLAGAPPGIGRLILSDGEKVRGFVCETQGVANAREITAIGDWRVFLQEGM